MTVDGSNAGSLVAVNGGGPTGAVFDRVQIRATTGFALIAGLGSTVRNSVLASANSVAVVMSGTLVGSTVTSDASSAVWVSTSYYQTPSILVRNSIVRGSGAVDVDVQDNDGAGPKSALLDIDYSAVRATGIALSGPNATASVGTHNVSTSALLSNPTLAADVHQLPASPTIDAGTAASAQGLDIDGDARTIGSAPDIGADEFVPAPTLGPAAASAVASTTASVTGSINPNGAATTYYVQFGPTAAYGNVTPEVTIPAGTSAQSVTVNLTGLTASAGYHARLVARNTTGTTNGTDVAFTTTATPIVAPPVAPATPLDTAAPTLGPPSLAGRALRFTLSEDATITMNVDRLRLGRRAKGVCRVLAASGPKCTRVSRVGTLRRQAAAASAAELKLPSELAGRRLVGRYRLTLVATDAAGNRSVIRKLTVRLT